MKRIFKNKFIVCIIAAVVALSAAVFAVFSFNENTTKVYADDTTTAIPVTNPIYWGVQNGNTLVFDNKNVTGTPSGSFDGNTTIHSNDYNSEVLNNATVRNAITTVDFAGEIAPVSTDNWFYNFSNLKTVTNGSNLKMDNVTYAECMFQGCSKLESIDVSKWDVSKCEYFGRMFSGCSKLNNLDVSKWDTSNVDSFIFMFEDCSSLTSLDVSGWDTAKVYHMNGVFKGCSNLTGIDVSGWNTANVQYFTNMFNGCSKLRYADLSGFDISKATNITDMFNGTSSLEVLKLSASAIDCFKNPPAAYATYSQDPKLPTLKSKDGNTTYPNVSSLPDSGTFLTNVAHTHTAAATDTGTVTAPTCTAGGYTTKTCKMCDEQFKVDLKNALGHDYQQDGDIKPATCMTDGSKPLKCSRCDATKTETLPKTGIHTGGTASCTKKAVCTVCKSEYGDLLPHTQEVDPAVPATCTEKGKTAGVHCSVCSTVLTPQTDTEKLPHTFGAWSSVDDNEHTHSCTGDNCTETETVPHTYGVWVTDIQPTENTEGSQHRDCSACGHRQTQPIPVLGHTHSFTWVEEEAADCTKAGTVGHNHCGGCNLDFDASGTQLSDLVIPKLSHSFTNYVSNNDATCTADGTKTAQCSYGCGEEDTVADDGSALGHNWADEWSKDETNHWHACLRCDEINDNAAHTHEWVITTPATTEAAGLMENLCTDCGHKDGEEEIAKLVDPNGEIDLPVDINVEFKVTQSSTDNDYSDIDHNLKRGYWAQLWCKNDDGTLGDEFTDKINCFITLKIPTEVIEAIRGGDEINRDKIAAGLSVYYINEEGAPVSVEKFTIAMRDDDSWQIKFNYNEKFRAEVVFAADVAEDGSESAAGIPWWVWLIVGLVAVAIVGVVIVIIVVAKKKNDGGDGGVVAVAADNGEVLGRLDKQDQKIDQIIEIVDGGFNDMVDE